MKMLRIAWKNHITETCGNNKWLPEKKPCTQEVLEEACRKINYSQPHLRVEYWLDVDEREPVAMCMLAQHT